MKSQGPREEYVTASVVRKMIKDTRDYVSEPKSLNIIVTGQATVATGSLWQLSQGIVLGDALNNRDGRQIYVDNINLQIRATTGVTSGTVRFVLFQDRFSNGVLPVVGDVLGGSTWISEYNQTYITEAKRFKILRDVKLDVNIAGESIKTRTYKIKKLLRGVVFLSDTDVPGANGRNAIYMIVIGSNATCLYDWSSQVVFKDQ